MVMGNAIWIIGVSVISLWILFKVIRLRRKLFVIILIGLILFGYLSFSAALQGHKVDLGNFEGVSKTFGIYFSWIGSSFGSTQSITSKAVENNSQESRIGDKNP